MEWPKGTCLVTKEEIWDSSRYVLKNLKHTLGRFGHAFRVILLQGMFYKKDTYQDTLLMEIDD
jgi:hypothetical protein